MNPLTNLIWKLSKTARSERASIFRSIFDLGPETKILDLGSEAGANINLLLETTSVRAENIYIADIDAEAVKAGNRAYGYNPVVVDESGTLPFDDQYFDIVYCSSVIEHVTIPKDEVWCLYSGRIFKQRSLARQKEFADEIRRLGKEYFVQTPYKHFPIESHSWLPFVAWLPRRLLIPVLRFTNLFWIKKTRPDWYLLNKKETRSLFDDAEIVEEKTFGLVKSVMAVKSRRDHPQIG